MNKIDILKFNNEKKNMVYGPYSILVALSMLDEGATEATKESLDLFLGNIPINKYNNIENVLSVANKMYIKDDIAKDINESYKNVLSDKYNAEIEINDFSDEFVMNNWINNKTFGQIKNIVTKDALLNNNLFLINTTAIDMEWQAEINGSSVNGGIFNNGSEVEASYIYGFTKNMASYYENDEVLSLGLNLKKYDDNDYEFVAIQPKGVELSEYINNLSDNKVNNILANLKSLLDEPRNVDISIPKFSFNYSLNCLSTFKNMGLENVFENAHFGKIGDLPTLNLDVLHKTNIDFSEVGLKAASATVVLLFEGAYFDPNERLIIEINKPFMFVIREKNKNDILFMGTVYNPVLWADDSKNYAYK
ncbi:MAG: hypothetical protein IKG27_02325 [Bacilli bacterium]|nr:hypothetical protein [Bacilli bacterium]